MIGEAIQEVLSGVIPNTYSAEADENVTLPYCIHEETDTPLYLKEGLAGYSWAVDIAIIHTLPDLAESLAVQVIAAMDALQGTTRKTTIIETVEYMNSDQGFDQASRTYMKLLQFTINTKNR